MERAQIAANKGFPVAFPLRRAQKDLRLVLQLADEVGQPLFVTAAINEPYRKAVAENLGDADFAAISRIIR